MFRIWLCNTSGICSYNCSQSLSFSLLLSNRNRGRASCSFFFPTEKDSSRFVNIPCLLFHAVPGWDFSCSSLENFPYKWVLCAIRCWTCPRLRHDCRRCFQPSSVFCLSRVFALGHTWFSNRYRYPWSQLAASNMSEYCSFQTHRGTYRFSSGLPWQPKTSINVFPWEFATKQIFRLSKRNV